MTTDLINERVMWLILADERRARARAEEQSAEDEMRRAEHALSLARSARQTADFDRAGCVEALADAVAGKRMSAPARDRAGSVPGIEWRPSWLRDA
jgi:hypothetical protein